MKLFELIKFNQQKYINEISTKVTSIELNSYDTKYELKDFSTLCNYFDSGVTYDKKKDVSINGKGNIVLTSDNITSNHEFQLVDNKKIILKEEKLLDKNKQLKKDDIFICLNNGSLKHIGKVALIDEDLPYYAGGFMGIIRVNDTVRSKYLYEILTHPTTRQNIKNIVTGSNINNLGSVINQIKLPIPPIPIQDIIIKEIKAVENAHYKQSEIKEIPIKKQAILDKYLK